MKETRKAARLTKLVLAALRFYRLAVSPSLGQTCRFYPSCSAYAEGAVRLHGPVRGAWLAARRLLRCHPWARGGINLVPLPAGPVALLAAATVEKGGL